MSEIHLIGIGDDGAPSLQPQLLDLIGLADILVGGERHLAFFASNPCEKWVIDGKLTELVKRIKQEQNGKKIVILASGDPMFYGIGGYLSEKMEGLIIHPTLSSVQLAFARIGMGWQDAWLTSFHGKPMHGFAQRVNGKMKVAILTDHIHTPPVIAKYLLHYGIEEYRVWVGEHLGGEDERTGWYSLQELAEMPDDAFSALLVVVLIRKPDACVPSVTLGIEDDQFSQRKPDRGLITKREVRVLSIAELKLHEKSVVWDIGTCTGSVAIEAAKQAPFGQVFGIEKNADDLENAKQNAAKFRADITLVHGKAPEGLENWPDPDAVFVGGSGGEMTEVLRISASRLRSDGRIVLNAATIETLSTAMTTFKELAMETRVTLLQTSRSKPILDMTRFEGMNPIYIITAWKKESEAPPHE